MRDLFKFNFIDASHHREKYYKALLCFTMNVSNSTKNNNKFGAICILNINLINLVLYQINLKSCIEIYISLRNKWKTSQSPCVKKSLP